MKSNTLRWIWLTTILILFTLTLTINLLFGCVLIIVIVIGDGVISSLEQHEEFIIEKQKQDYNSLKRFLK